MTAQHAVRQGKQVARNVAASLGHGTAKPYQHHDEGFLVDLGGAAAAANPLNIPLSGPVANAVTRGYHLSAMSGNRMRVLGARVAADAVLPELRDRRGSLLFTGGGYALHPSKVYASLSVGKAALRAYVQMLHEQLTGTNVHATSITVTAAIGSEARFEPPVIAKSYLDLHPQPQPQTDWQPELLY